MTAQQRLKILDVIGEPYVCCGGMFPCGPLGEPQDRTCVWAEACCCPGLALGANRFLIQTRFDRENTPCDDCILWTICLAQWAVCILECAGVDVPDEIENLVDCMRMAVNGCMLAQQQVEIELVEQTGYNGANPAIMGALPPFQQQLLSSGKPPQQHSMGGMGVGAAAFAGAAVAGGAGAAAMGGVAMGHGVGKQQAAAPPQMMGASRMSNGFMATAAPNGMPWSTYCQSQQVAVANGLVAGAWGECLAWAKVFEIQNPGWANRPEYREDGPCGQVVEAMCSHASPGRRPEVEQAAGALEEACERCAQNGQAMPIIGFTV